MKVPETMQGPCAECGVDGVALAGDRREFRCADHRPPNLWFNGRIGGDPYIIGVHGPPRPPKGWRARLQPAPPPTGATGEGSSE